MPRLLLDPFSQVEELYKEFFMKKEKNTPEKKCASSLGTGQD